MDEFRLVTNTKNPDDVTGNPVFLAKFTKLIAQFEGDGMALILIVANAEGTASLISNLAEDGKINHLLEHCKVKKGPDVIVTAASLQ